MTTVSIHLLGTAQIRAADGTTLVLRRRARLLVFFLASLHEPVSRERVATMFWPDEAPDTSRQLLRTALHQIKLACGAIVSSDTQSLSLAPIVPVDVRILAAAQPGDAVLDALLQQPPGVFCADLDTGGIEALEAWVDSERARWHRRIADVLLQHAQWLARNGNIPRALTAVAIAIEHEPLREESSQLAMRLHMRANDRAAAIACYEALSHALDDQLGVPPMPATTALYHDIVTDRFAEPEAPTTTAPAPPAEIFVGRQAELTQLHGLPWDGRVIAISGPAGIGKTRLAQEYLRRSHALIVHAVAYAGDEVLPYMVLGRAIRTLLHAPRWQQVRTQPVLADVWQRELRRLWPELPGGEPDALVLDGADARLPEAVALLLTQLADTQRLVLFLDDVQWFDDASARVLLAIVRRGLSTSWQMVLTSRPGALPHGVSQLLAHADRTGGLTRLVLTPLSAADSLLLARSLDPAVTDTRIQCAEGNPLLVTALVRSDPQESALPAAVHALTQSRLAGLSAAARALVVAGAVAGRVFDYLRCGALMHLDDHQAVSACDELVRSGVVMVSSGTTVRFDHPLTVEAILAEAGHATQVHLHRDMALSLAALEPVDHAQVARHYAAAGMLEAALPFADAAARTAQDLGAWNEAEYYLRLALQATPEHAQAQRWLELGEMLMWAGSESAAAEALERAIESDESIDGHIADAARLGLARSMLPTARYDTAISIAEPLTHHADPHIAMHALFICGTAYSLAGMELDTSARYLSQAEAACLALDARDILPRVLFEHGGLAAQQGDLTGALARYRAALHAAEANPGPANTVWRILSYNNLAYHSLLLGALADAQRYARTAARLAQRAGLLRLLSYIWSTTGEIALARGDTHAAEKAFRDALECAERFGMAERIAGIHANLGLVARANGEQPRAITLLRAALAEADAVGVHHLATQIRIWLAALVPDPEAQRYLADARTLAAHGGRARLLAEIERVGNERGFSPTSA